jgi:membrane protein
MTPAVARAAGVRTGCPENARRSDLSWPEIVRDTLREVNDDRCTGLAAQLAFYFLLALFPALMFAAALVGYLPLGNLLSKLLAELGAVAPPQLVTLLRAQLEAITTDTRRSLLTLGVLGAVWSSSAAFASLIDALNQAFDVEERRPWWRRRILAILLTVSLVTLVLAGMAGLLIGPDLGARVAVALGVRPLAASAWAVTRWPLTVLSAIATVDLIYHFAPNRSSRWTWITPGGVLATVLWIVSSLCFKYYVSHFGHYTATYGAIGGAIVTMLWLYVSALALLVGAELNAVIERHAIIANNNGSYRHGSSRSGHSTLVKRLRQALTPKRVADRAPFDSPPSPRPRPAHPPR